MLLGRTPGALFYGEAGADVLGPLCGLCHGDDFIVVAGRKRLEAFEELLSKHFGVHIHTTIERGLVLRPCEIWHSLG